MTPYQQRRCPLTQRLAEDMKIRNLAQATIDAYTYHARRFADFIQKPLDRATVEDVRNFQLHLIETRKLAYSSFNQAVCALRFLYTHTIRVPWPVTMVPFGKRPKTLAHGAQPTRSRRAAAMYREPQTPNVSVDPLRLRDATLRSGPPADPRHRLGPHADPYRPRQGGQGTTACRSRRGCCEELRTYWKAYRPSHFLFPGKTPGQAVRRHLDPESDQAVGRASRDHQERPSACTATFLRDRTAGSGRGLADDQPAAGSRQLHHDDGLSALSSGESGFDPQSAGLVAGPATAHVPAGLRRTRASATRHRGES